MQPHQSAQTSLSPSRRVAAYAAIVLGALGIVLGLVGVVGVWYGRSLVGGLSSDLTGSVDNGLQQASGRLDGALERVGQTRERLQSLQTDAQQLGSGPAGRAAAERLGAALDRELGPPLAALRGAYSATGARVAAGIDVLNALNRLPGVNVPQPPTQELAALDARLQEIDGELQSVRQSLDDQGLPLGTLGSRIAQRIVNVDTRVGALQSAVQGVRGELDRARDAVARVHAAVLQTTLWLALGLTLLLVWSALLHLLLLLRGRAWLEGDPRIGT